MSASNQYMALLRHTDWDEGMSVEEISGHIDNYQLWCDRMVAEGKISGGMPLLAPGRTVGKQSNGISDGPFIESKEAIGGYILVNAADFESAAEIMKTFPPVACGVQVEIRQTSAICPISLRLEKRLAAEPRLAEA